MSSSPRVGRSSTLPTTDIADLDEIWRLAGGMDGDAVVIDLTHEQFLSHQTALYLVALFHDRARRGLRTWLSLPRRDTAVDFLRAWQVPEALESATDLRFEDLLDPSSRKLFAELPPFPRYVTVADRPDGGREGLLPVSFFGCTPLRVSGPDYRTPFSSTPRRAAAVERDRYLQTHIRNVLDRYFRQSGDEIATKVVYEAVLNAASHSFANLGFASSQLMKYREGPLKGTPKALEISVWDNGRSFSETLGARLDAGLSIRGSAFGGRDEEFEVRIEGPGGPLAKVLRSDSTQDDASEAALMVSAFMLGITSRPDRQFDIDEDFPPAVPTDPGTGLFHVREITIDKFGGSLHYLSGTSRVSITGAGRPGTYRASVTQLAERCAPVAGNLLIATIPASRHSTPEEAGSVPIGPAT